MTYIGLLKSYPRYISYGMAYFFFSSLGQTFLFSLFIPNLESTFGMSPAESGAYYGMASLLSAGLILYTGSFVDKWNLRIFGGLVALALGLSAFLMATAQTFAMMLVGMFLLRHFGQGLMIQTASTAVARYFTNNRGKALSLKSLGISIAEAILPTIVALLIATFGWRYGMAALGAACLLVCLPMNLFMLKHDERFSQPIQDGGEDGDTKHKSNQKAATTIGSLPDAEELNWGRKQLLSHSYFWLVFLHVMGPAFIITGLFFQQVAFAEAQGWSVTLMASAFLAFGIIRTIASLGVGPFVDKLSGTKLLPITTLPMALGIACLLLNDAPYLVYFYMGLMGFSVGIGGTITTAMWVEVYGRKHLGAIKSMVMSLAVFSTAVSPPLVGWLFENGHTADDIAGYSIAYILISAVMAWVAKPPKAVK